MFENRNIRTSVYAYSAKFEVGKSEQKSHESFGERVKLRRQKPDKLNKMITKKDKTISKELFKNYFYQFEKKKFIC